jgi:hypothetical protein
VMYGWDERERWVEPVRRLWVGVVGKRKSTPATLA